MYHHHRESNFNTLNVLPSNEMYIVASVFHSSKTSQQWVQSTDLSTVWFLPYRPQTFIHPTLTHLISYTNVRLIYLPEKAA